MDPFPCAVSRLLSVLMLLKSLFRSFFLVTLSKGKMYISNRVCALQDTNKPITFCAPLYLWDSSNNDLFFNACGDMSSGII